MSTDPRLSCSRTAAEASRGARHFSHTDLAARHAAPRDDFTVRSCVLRGRRAAITLLTRPINQATTRSDLLTRRQGCGVSGGKYRSSQLWAELAANGLFGKARGQPRPPRWLVRGWSIAEVLVAKAAPPLSHCSTTDECVVLSRCWSLKMPPHPIWPASTVNLNPG